jgi:CHAD domain-containing protein
VAKALPIPDVSARTPFGSFAARVIEVRTGEVEALLAAQPTNGDTGLVHDRRVAIRRLRTAIEIFEPALPKRARTVRRELKGAFAALGPRRDADVALETLGALEPELAPADRPGWAGLVAELEALRGAAGALDEEQALSASTEAALLAPQARERGGPPAMAALQRTARRRVGAVRRRLPALEDPRDATALHGLRLAAKRLRYVLDAAVPALGDPAVRGASAARDLQTLLGDIHDYDVLLPRLRAHRRALRAADVAAVRAGGRPPNTERYRGVQTVDTHVRARRDALRAQAAGQHAPFAAALDALEAELRR